MAQYFTTAALSNPWPQLAKQFEGSVGPLRLIDFVHLNDRRVREEPGASGRILASGSLDQSS